MGPFAIFFGIIAIAIMITYAAVVVGIHLIDTAADVITPGGDYDQPDIIPDDLLDDTTMIVGGAIGVGVLLLAVVWWSK